MPINKPEYIIIHCSDSDIPSHDNIATIRKWHVDENKWRDVGYHFFIRKSGELEYGRPIWESGAHAKGYNRNSIGICLSGSVKFTAPQFDMLKEICLELSDQYGIPFYNIVPHSAVTSGKTCPNFNLYDLKADWIE
jgi:N-acetylmuramoyl-L-alanine amidase